MLLKKLVSPLVRGVMITPAMPTGVAQFDQAECDVLSRSGPLDVGDAITVVATSGASLQVERVTAD